MDTLLLRAALLDELSAPLREVRDELRSVEREVRRLGTAAVVASAETGKLGSATALFEQKISGASTMAQRFGSHLRSLVADGFALVTEAAERATFAIGALVVATGMYGLKLAINNEQFKVGLAAMLGSETAAKDLYDQLQSFAKVTPFTFVGLKPLTSQLIGVGFQANQVIPILRGLGDVVAGVGGGEEVLRRVVQNLGQIQAAGKVDGRSMRDFAMNGIPALDQLSQKLGITKQAFTELMHTQGGSIDLFNKLGGGAGIAEALGEGRFKNMMDKQSKTVGGILSNIKDAFQAGLGDAMEGLFPVLKPALQKLQARIEPVMKQFGRNFGAAITAFSSGNMTAGSSLLARAFGLPPGAARIIERVISVVSTGIESIMRNGPVILRAIGAVVAEISSVLGTILPPVFNVMKGIAGLVSNLAVTLKPALETALTDVHAIADVIAFVFTQISDTLKKIDEFRPPAWLRTAITVASPGLAAFIGKDDKNTKKGSSGSKNGSVGTGKQSAPGVYTPNEAAYTTTPMEVPSFLDAPAVPTSPLPPTNTTTNTVTHINVPAGLIQVNGGGPDVAGQVSNGFGQWMADFIASERERSAA